MPWKSVSSVGCLSPVAGLPGPLMRPRPMPPHLLPGSAHIQALPSSPQALDCIHATSICTRRRRRRRPTVSASASRREMMMMGGMFPPLLLTGTDDPTTILNSVLSAYGLPMLKSNDTLREYDDFENDWSFSYPRSWVARTNTQRSGFYVSNFQTADKATVESFTLTSPAAEDAEVVRKAVIAAVVPGSEQGQGDDKLTLPAERLVKTEAKTIDGQRYIYLTFPSETLTRSGYAIKRRHWAVVAVNKRGVGFTLSASARSDQYNKDKEALLRAIVDTFRVR